MKFFTAFIFALGLALGLLLANRANYKAQSWDQENLKRHDHGCPTAIYIAPGGKLEQCS